MNQRHLKWCLLHDWGETAELMGGEIVLQIDDLGNPEENRFDSFEELLIWAGY